MLLDTTTFLSIWYWLLMAVFWAMATHFTHGVPYDVLWRAARYGGEDADICDRLTRRMLARIEAGVRRWGLAGAAVGGFTLAVLSVLSAAGSQVALGLLTILAPAVGMLALSVAEAVRLVRNAEPVSPEALRAILFRRRWANQFAGVLAVAASGAALVLTHRDSIALFQPF